jgi:hypothetical protein
VLIPQAQFVARNKSKEGETCKPFQIRSLAYLQVGVYILSEKMNANQTDHSFSGLFGDIIEGRVVKRSKHRLEWNRKDVSHAFRKALQLHGYAPLRVQEVNANPGERIPAFFVEDRIAYFGWVFWEKFTG